MSPDRGMPLIDHAAYSFQIALSDAITRYVRELRRTQFRALTYRGADFGRAIAIELYFRLVNDGALRSAYGRHLAGESLPQDADAIPMSTVAYWVFRQILRRGPPVRRRRRLKDYVNLTYAMGLAHLEKKQAAASRTGPVIILALTRRFFDYLKPVSQALSADVIWLVPANSDWSNAFEDAGEKFIRFETDVSRRPSAPMTRPLTDWRELPARYDLFLEILDSARPSAVIMTEGNQTSDEILARAAETVGIRSICIQQGWSPIVHTGFRDMRYSAFCAWGPEFARLLQPYNHRQNFAVTGSHRVGPNTASANGRAISFFLQNNSLLITPRAWDEMLAYILWVATNWPNRPVLVREHPASPLTDAEKAQLAKTPNIQLCPAASVSLRDVLQQTGIAVAFYSTTLIEALAVGAVPLIVNITGAPHYSPDLAALGAGLEVQNFDAAREVMSRFLSGGDVFFRQRATLLAPRFFACSTGTALQNISAIIKSHQ